MRERERGPALELIGATLAGELPGQDALRGVSLELRPGDLVVIRHAPGWRSGPVADAVCGLSAPREGEVRVFGRSWRSMRPRAVEHARARIGRVAERTAWVPYLTVGEGVLMAQEHHTHRPGGALREEASELCRAFGLPDLPGVRPASLPDADLRRAALARAFMGRPMLLALEHPTRGVLPTPLPALAQRLTAARLGGAAALILTDEEEVWSSPALAATATLEVAQGRLVRRDAA